MARKVDPNTDSPPDPHTRKSRWDTEDQAQAREASRAEDRVEAVALDETVSMSEADARREVPRLRTDSANPKKDQRLPSPSAVRPMLSSRRKKEYNKAKRAWVEAMPKTQYRQYESTMTNREELEGVMRALHAVNGRKSDLPPALRRRVEAIDRGNQAFERSNEREHVVYAALKAPKDHGNSRNALRRHLTEMAADDDAKPTLTFDSYIPATHSMGQIAEGPEIVMEIRTRSGSYLGTSDTTPEADHLVSRGRELRPVGVHEATYTKQDGSQGTRWVVQMEDVTVDGRTAARG